MRVATANSYDNTIANLVKRQSDLNAQQERISTGKRVQRASDDPVSAVLSETAQNRLSRVTADLRAVEASRTSLAQAESALGESGELIQQVRDVMIAAGNATFGPREHKDLATQLEGLRDQMLSVANRQDSAGRTLFGGLGGSSTPFVDVYSASGSAVHFDGLRGQEAAGNNSLPQALDGEAIWMRIPQGNGSFTLSLPATNTGAVRTDVGRVTNPSDLTGDTYSVDFASVGGVMQYSITNTATGDPVTGHTGVPYQSGQAVAFEGMSFQMSGNPAPGDRVDVAPPSGLTNLFKVVQDTIDALRSTGTGGTTQLTHTLSRTLTELDAGHDRVLQARSQSGEWLNRADAIDSLLGDRAVDYQAERSRLEDLDMVKGISDFQSQQVGLEAALKSYAQVQRLSLFQYVG